MLDRTIQPSTQKTSDAQQVTPSPSEGEATPVPSTSPELVNNDQQPLRTNPGHNMHFHSTNPQRESREQLANQVRDLDLETVALDLGLDRDRHDKHKWRGEGQIISINGSKFYDHLNQTGSGGAISLVMHVNNCPYQDAVNWLADRSATPPRESPDKTGQPSKQTTHGADRYPSIQGCPVLSRKIGTRPGLAPSFKPEVAKTEPKYLVLPIKDETNWANVRDYLAKTRGLPEALVDALHSKGLIYADTMNNAVFLRHATSDWQRGEQTGANLRGTVGKFHRLSPGTERDKGWFTFSVGKGELKRIVLTESAIDALSKATLDKINGRTEGMTVYLSVDGAGAVPSSDLKAILERGGRVELAFDADPIGDQMAERLLAQLPGATRVRPEIGKDWNEQLLHQQPSKLNQSTITGSPRLVDNLPSPSEQKTSSSVRTFQQQVDQVDKHIGDFLAEPGLTNPSLDTLRHWYRAARGLGKTQQYLQRITEIANSFKAGQPLSDKALNIMRQDFGSHKQVQEVLTSARNVLQAWGQSSEVGTQHFKGKKYELHESGNGLTVSTAERGIIFSYQQGQVQKNQLDATDLKAFESIRRQISRDRSPNQDLENER